MKQVKPVLINENDIYIVAGIVIMILFLVFAFKLIIGG